MYNFKKRVGLAIGTANPNDEDIQNTATGLGGLILRSDLYNKALAGANNNKLENFDSFVVTNPDLVDEGIDISGLRTTTDTSPYLLGNIPDYGGIQYEAYNPNRLSDLMRLYSGGFPMLDTPQAAPDFTGGEMIDTGGGGGMDQVTGGSVAGFDPGVTPGPSGFIGLDPDMDINTQDITDYGTYDPPELGGADGMSGGQATPGAEFANQNPYGGDGTMDDLGADSFPDFDFGPQPGISNPRAPGQNTVTQDTTAMDTTPSAPPSLGFGNAYEEPMTQQDLIDSDANVGFVDTPSFKTVSEIEANDPNFRYKDQFMEDIRGLPQDIKDRFNEIKESPLGQGISNFKNYLMDKGGQQVANNVIKFGDTTIDIAKSLTSGAISIIGKALTGIPGLGLLASLLPEGGRSDMSDALGAQYGMDDIGRLTGGPMAGYAVDSGFGKGIEQATIDRINSIKNRSLPQTDASKQKIKELEGFLEQITRNNLAIDYDMEGTDEGDRAAEEDAAADEAFADTGDYDVYAGGGADQDPVGPGFGATDYADPGVDAEENQPDGDGPSPSGQGATADIPDRGRGQNNGGGGGSSSGGGGQQSSGGGYNEGNFCFDPNTPIQMADGSNKKIKDIQLGDDTKGGEVTGVFQFKATDEIHDYKGVTVAGSHYVKEDGKFIMVQDSPLAVKIDKIPVVYSLDTTGRRIFIKDIEFADYNGDGVAKNFLSNAGVTLEGFDKEVLRQVQQRLI